MTGITEILRAVDSDNSKVSFIDLEGVVINGKVSYMIERIRKKRRFKCSQHLIIDSEDVLGVKMGESEMRKEEANRPLKRKRMLHEEKSVNDRRVLLQQLSHATNHVIISDSDSDQILIFHL